MPTPDPPEAKASSLIRLGRLKFNSMVSSIVITLCSTGTSCNSRFKRVLFPVPVPPLTMTFARARTHALKKSTHLP